MQQFEVKDPDKQNTKGIIIKLEKNPNQIKKLDISSPPNPLFPRKFLPIPSPKFGKNIHYLKLNQFIENEIEKEVILQEINDVSEKFYENMELENFANSPSFIENLVYCRNEKTKDHKISLENIVNLKKKADIPLPKPTNFLPYYSLKNTNDSTLIFESRFESGNLLAASKKEENQYQLILQNDTNTNGYNQWFFFRVSNTKKSTKVKFNIINLNKKYSLYNKGMRIMVYSEKKAEIEKIGWHRNCEEIGYYRNGLFKVYKDRKSFLSSLVFVYNFEYSEDIVYFANSIPYTYTELNKKLIEYEKNEKIYNFITRKSLCTTLGGNNVDILTITSNEKNDNINNRPGVIIMARVHPGETVSSWMMKGVLEFLTSSNEEAILLRQNYVFKIIPMLNPDGVITGNYRTSFAGCDLNRRWVNPNEVLYPEIYALKNAIMKFAKSREIALICDLHGHSGLHNVFMYGNQIVNDPYACKLFPFVMSKINKSFHFGNCSYKIQKSKNGCARINLFNELKFPNIFTMEASFSGCKYGDYQNIFFNTSILKEIGRDLCKAILSYQNNYDLFYSELINCLNENQLIKESLINKTSINLSYNEENNDNNKCKGNNENMFFKECGDTSKQGKESDGSDSEPSADNIDKEELLKLLPSHAKKKIRVKKKKTVLIIKPVKSKIEEKNNNSSVNKEKNIKFVATNKDLALGKELQNNSKLEKLIFNIKPVIINNSYEKDKVLPIDPKKRDQETQTEEIFFKMNWTFFKAKSYKIITPRSINDSFKRQSESVSKDKKLYIFHHNLNQSVDQKSFMNRNNIKKDLNSTNKNFLYNSNSLFKVNTNKYNNIHKQILKSPLQSSNRFLNKVTEKNKKKI